PCSSTVSTALCSTCEMNQCAPSTIPVKSAPGPKGAVMPSCRRGALSSSSKETSSAGRVRPTGSCEPATPSSTASRPTPGTPLRRSEEHTSELQSRFEIVCRLLLEKKKQRILQ